MWLAWIGINWLTGKARGVRCLRATDHVWCFHRRGRALWSVSALPTSSCSTSRCCCYWASSRCQRARCLRCNSLVRPGDGRQSVCVCLSCCRSRRCSPLPHRADADELTVVRSSIPANRSASSSLPPDADGQPQDTEQWLQSYFQQAGSDKRSEDYWSVQTFDGRPTIRLSPSLGEVTIPLGSIDEPYEGSNVQRAIESAMSPSSGATRPCVSSSPATATLTARLWPQSRPPPPRVFRSTWCPCSGWGQGRSHGRGGACQSRGRKGQTIKVSVELRSADRVPGQLLLNTMTSGLI